MAILTDSVAAKVSDITLPILISFCFSPNIVMMTCLPDVLIMGYRKMSPHIATKLSWNEVVQRSCGCIAIITAAANASDVIVLRCLPSKSAVKKRLAMIAVRITGGLIPVNKT